MRSNRTDLVCTKGVSLDKFAKWSGEPAAAAEKNTPVASVKSVTPEVGERQDLAVRHKDRAEAKAAGAKWDKEKKPGTPKPGLICKNWRSGNLKTVIEQSPAMTLQEEVETALKDIGCILVPILTGARSIQLWMVRKHRITVEGDKKGEKSGFISSTLTAILQALCRTTALKPRWSSKGYVRSDEEKASCGRRQLRNRPKKRHSSKDHESSAKRVEKQLAKLNEPQQQTAYLEKKGCRCIKACSLTRKGKKTFIPAYDVGG
ncbi:hypothetical protein [Klebsiella quasipneumoniae]|uniref:hypothetical protein n=1 Tax=Klebsiella quasipneumoniae TaxID=1463165 RepID=UPI00388F6857